MRVSGPGHMAQLPAIGSVSSCFTDTSGAVWCQGTNDLEILGREDVTTAALPTIVPDFDGSPSALGTANEVALAFYNGFVLTDTGEVWSWGSRFQKTLGTSALYSPWAISWTLPWAHCELIGGGK